MRINECGPLFLFVLPATQLESDGSSVGGRAAGGRRRLSSVSGLMIGIIVAGLIVFIIVSAVFFYLDYSRKRRWERATVILITGDQKKLAFEAK